MLKNGFTMGGGGVFGAAGGIIPGLANISSIIRGIPQIGQLAHAIISPLTDAAEEGVRLNMILETTEIGFTAVAGSADKAHQHVMKLQAFGAASPFRFEGLLKGAQLMNAFGFSIDEQIPKLTIWGNAIAASGEISEEAIHRVITAFGQMRMSGRVNAQDMMQLTNANLPGWQLLAKAIGKTVAETRKLAEQGKLNGKVAVEAITAMMAIDPRFKGMMDKLQTTTQGRLSALQDMLQIAQGTATQGLTGNLSKMIQDALDRPDLAPMLAAQINSVLTPVSGLIETGVKNILAPGITTGLTEGIKVGKTMVKDALMDMAQDSIIGTVKDVLGINSPSQVFINFGINSAEGYRDGILTGLESVSGEIMGGFDEMLGQVEGMLNSKTRRFLTVQQQSKSNLERLMAKEPDFMPKLVAGSRARGINPDHLLNVMAVETSGSFNPAIKNPTSSASGLIQFMAETARGLGTTTALLRKMTATQQLDYVFKYLDQPGYRGRLGSQGALYAAVGAGQVGSNDESVLMRRGQRGYAGNAATWDRNLDGIIRQGEMAQAAIVKLGAGVTFTVNGTPISYGNPVPVVFGNVTAGAGGIGAKPVKDIMGGAHLVFGTGGPGGPSDSFENGFGTPDLSGNVFASPDLLSTPEWDPSKLVPAMRPLKPLMVESAEAAAQLALEMAKAGETAQNQLGPGQWRESVMAIGSMQQKLSEFNDTLPKTRDMMTDIFISIPSRFGDIVGDAVNRADGTIGGFLSDLRDGFLSTVKGIFAEIAKTEVTKGLSHLWTMAAGTPEMDPNTGEPTGKVKGGIGIIKSILGIFGIGGGGKDVAAATATSANTTATMANTVAVTQLSATMAAQAALGAGQAGGGILGMVLGVALGAVGGSISLGGGSSYTPGGTGSTRPRTVGKRAFGGPVSAGHAVMVGDDPMGRPNPELFVPQTAGNIIPLDKLQGGGENHVHIHQHFHTPTGKVAPESSEQAAMKSVGAVARYFEQRGRNT